MARAENWPGWRGPRGDGSSHEQGLVLEWNVDEGRNLVWKTALPGSGHASPIVWGDRVLTVAADEATSERLLLCFDRRSGASLWRQAVLTAPLEGKHPLNSFASSTPATDGTRVFVSFLDREQMYVAAFDLEGQRLWSQQPGVFSSKHGYCSSPVLFEDLVIVNGDHDGDSYLVALDRATGQTRWKVARENRTRSYCVPLIRELGGRTQMLISGDRCVASYDPRNGSRHWVYPGPTDQFVATLVTHQDVALLTCGYPERHVMALRTDGEGTLSEEQVLWRTTKGAAYVPSPVVVDDWMLLVADNGVANAFHVQTGQNPWTERLGPGYSASAVTVEGRVYFTSDQGMTTVIEPQANFRKRAENPLGEPCYASPAVSQGNWYFRGERHLICIGQEDG
jgi:hypothetical protein